MFILESHLDQAQSRVVAEIQRIATEAGMNVWLTGGAMRDVLRGARVTDLDFTVERDAPKLAKQLAAALGGKVTADDSLKRWAELQLPGGITASLANARAEKYTKPGGKPQISPATIHEDLLRRDFTINAIGLTLNRGSRGLLIDPSNGQADLLNRELRATNPYVFFDDPSRIFRMVRFRFTLGFEVAPRLASQLENALLEDYQKHAGVAALAAEIRALSAGPNAVQALEEFDRLGLLKAISTGLTGAKLNAAGLAKLEKVSALPGVVPVAGRGWIAFLNILIQKLGVKERADALKAFQLPKEEADALKKLETAAKKLETALKASGQVKPSIVYETVSSYSFDEVLITLYNTAQRNVQDRIHAYFEKYLPMAQEITDEQVAATGVKPGTPKFEKARQAMVATHLNARPKKVVEPEPPPAPEPVAAAGRGRGK